jgi:NAD(P)-dependent dehydrogenase (short-subunit alcohol dehydrogenase family)
MKSTLFDLSRKNVLITGAGGTLGIIHAQAVAELGANIILTDISISALESVRSVLASEFPSVIVHLFVMDVTSEKSIRRVEMQLEKSEVEVDVLINNAAINPHQDSLNSKLQFEVISRKIWDNEIEVGLTGAFLCSQIFGYAMAQRKKGIIINIASDLSVIAPNQSIYKSSDHSGSDQPVKPVTYSVVKTGLIGLTRYLATYWANQNVRVNAISPGGIEGDQSEEFKEKISTLIPMGRMARAWELKGIIQFLSSDASTYVTGQNFLIDGGRSVW